MRTCGILMPVSCLPSKYGIGSFGNEAYRFIDFLAECRQTFWQILPLGPTGYGDSPYQSFSAFAGSPYYIDLDILAEEGYIDRQDIENAGIREEGDRIDYYGLYMKRFPVLKKACREVAEEDPKYRMYIAGNRFWIEDYALFMALKEQNDMKPFREWPDELRFRNEKVLNDKREELKDEIHFWTAVQFLFHEQWMKLKAYAGSRGIRIIGDIPIYVSEDSCELWMHPELFQTDEQGRPTAVAGCPPDEFAEEGQLWGNPLYDWNYHRETGYRWWIKRLEHSGCFFDVVRIDHFRGFSGYYSVPAGNINAVEGEWREGPGKDFISVIKEKVSWLPVIAEDLGVMTEDSAELLRFSGFPGMKVMQFAFSSDWHNGYLPHNYEKSCVAYTGTHDNPTTEEWVQTASPAEIKKAMSYLGADSITGITDAMIRAAFSSTAETVIIPVQDWLKAGPEARLNTPSTLGNNWVWRLHKDYYSDELVQKIRSFTLMYGREPG